MSSTEPLDSVSCLNAPSDKPPLGVAVVAWVIEDDAANRAFSWATFGLMPRRLAVARDHDFATSMPRRSRAS